MCMYLYVLYPFAAFTRSTETITELGDVYVEGLDVLGKMSRDAASIAKKKFYTMCKKRTVGVLARS